MPSGKASRKAPAEKSKDDTWKEAELAKYLQTDSSRKTRDHSRERTKPSSKREEVRKEGGDRRDSKAERKERERASEERERKQKDDEKREKRRRTERDDRRHSEKPRDGSVDRRKHERRPEKRSESKERQRGEREKSRKTESGRAGSDDVKDREGRSRRRDDDAGAPARVRSGKRERDSGGKRKRELIEKKVIDSGKDNKLGKLSPELEREESLDDGGGDDAVKRREKELLEKLAIEEHNQKMRQRQEEIDDEVTTAVEEEDEDTHLRGNKLSGVVAPVAVLDDGGGAPAEDLYDEDDFEDYDEDFEEDDDEDLNLNEVLQAINKENKLHESLKGTKQSRSPSLSQEDQSGDTPPRPVSMGFGFNFRSALDRQTVEKAAKKSKKRGEELVKLIELDFYAIEILDLAPQSEYELYIKRYGRANTRQVFVQTNEDDVEQEVQTEPIPITEKWTQHPPEDVHGFGGGNLDKDDDEEELTYRSEDSMRLSTFVSKASQVVSILLEESSSGVSHRDSHRKKSSQSFSCGYVSLPSTASAFSGRRPVVCTFSPTQTNLLGTAFGAPPRSVAASLNDIFSDLGLVCVWNINDTKHPEKVLVCESWPLCCCFGPSKASLVFAGTDDGSVVVWDLREPVSMHRTRRIGDVNWVVRAPTYTTAGSSSSDSHQSPITSIASVVSKQGTHSSFTEDQSDGASGLSYQVATLDESGVVNIWVVVELYKPDPAGSESDLGLVPGGRVKLVPSASVVVETPSRFSGRVPMRFKPFEFDFNPDDPNHFYIATDLGCVLHGIRYGNRAIPHQYKTRIDVAIDVTTVDVSPFSSSYFLAGCSDGSIRLHSIRREYPILHWNRFGQGSSIQCVRWSRSRPHVFYALDRSPTLHIWDLKVSDAAPVVSEKFDKKKPLAFCLSNDHVALGIGLPGRQPEMALCFADGSVESHILQEKYSSCQPNEVSEFIRYAESNG